MNGCGIDFGNKIFAVLIGLKSNSRMSFLFGDRAFSALFFRSSTSISSSSSTCVCWFISGYMTRLVAAAMPHKRKTICVLFLFVWFRTEMDGGQLAN